MHTTLGGARRHLSFANVTSLLALVVALGGTSYAAVVLPANSVDSREIRTNAVGPPEIRAGGVGASELRTDSVRPSEIRANAVRAAEVATNAIGPEEIAPDAVAAGEIASGAVGTDELRDGEVELADLSAAARTALVATGAVSYRAAVTPAGASAGGTASFVTRTAAGEYSVSFPTDVSACQYAATLAAVRGPATAWSSRRRAGSRSPRPASPRPSSCTRSAWTGRRPTPRSTCSWRAERRARRAGQAAVRRSISTTRKASSSACCVLSRGSHAVS